MDFWVRYLSFYVMMEALAGRELPVTIIQDPEKIGVFSKDGRILILLQNEYYMLIPVLPNAGWGLPTRGGSVKYLRW